MLQFRAMNTAVEADGAGPELPGWFAEVEATLTRFDDNSPLSRLNALTGRWVVVPPMLFQAIQAALRSAAATAGAYDPTILAALEAAGYTRSFEQGPTPVRPTRPGGRWREVKLEPAISAVWLPPGVRLDLGGIGKGLAVDWAMERAAGDGPLLINAGGDLAVRGVEPYIVEVEDPFDFERTLLTFPLQNAAAATSSIMGRRFGPGLHHIIDPATGRPADSGIVAATVIAKSVARAEVLAKAAIVLGPVRGLAMIHFHKCHGLLVQADGKQLFTDGWEEYRHGAA
jgi:thiamine biosynthesis lipoprotein